MAPAVERSIAVVDVVENRGLYRVFASRLRGGLWKPLTTIGRTPKGAYSSRGRSGNLLENAFSEPLLRTPSENTSQNTSQNPFYCKIHSKPPSQNPSQNPSENPSPEPFSDPSQNAVLPYDPLGVHPKQEDISDKRKQTNEQGFCEVGLTAPLHQKSVEQKFQDPPTKKRRQMQTNTTTR